MAPYVTFQASCGGAYFAWKATAMGKNYVNGKTFLEKRYNMDLELEDAIHTAILTLKVIHLTCSCFSTSLAVLKKHSRICDTV
uniref:Uncharacterized protein n=1 Tax=Hucho hucho TaxID=62062 RepID=A0A4W5L1X2_9TELE